MTTETGPERKSLRQQLQIPADPLWFPGLVAATVAIASLLLPWVWIDDYPAPLNAAQLFFFYPTSNEKWYLLRTTPLGSMTTMFGPALLITMVICNAAMAIRRKPSIWLSVATIAGAAYLLLMTGEILDPDRQHVGPMPVPEFGIILLVASQAVIIGLSWYRRYRDAPAGTRYRGIPFLARPPSDQPRQKSFEW